MSLNSRQFHPSSANSPLSHNVSLNSDESTRVELLVSESSGGSSNDTLYKEIPTNAMTALVTSYFMSKVKQIFNEYKQKDCMDIINFKNFSTNLPIQ